MTRVQRLLVFSIVVAAAAILVAGIRLATLDDSAGTAPEQVEVAGDDDVAGSDGVETVDAGMDGEPVDAARPVRRVRIALVQGIPKGGPAKVRMRVGEELRLTVTSTGAEDTIIVNGFNLQENVSPDSPARFTVVPDRPGYFDVFMQTSGTKLADLDIVQ
jgi:hypothetical protein